MRIDVEAEDRLAELESLAEWLADVDELRGKVQAVESAPPTGTLGPLLDALEVALGPGGAAAAVAASVIAWLRSRAGRITVTLERPDGTKVSVDAVRVRGLRPDDVRAEVEGLLKAIEPPDEVPGDRQRR
ncbi:hypothetical protein AB0I60_21655 [Actinosynnema sp. NPDC050436]|uniref:effector-associated constant component EACC1 n=1 Tax=Actinosynnema sp. NPDC050436 TaxID=3155659 RepID=UPI0033CE7AA5